MSYRSQFLTATDTTCPPIIHVVSCTRPKKKPSYEYGYQPVAICIRIKSSAKLLASAHHSESLAVNDRLIKCATTLCAHGNKKTTSVSGVGDATPYIAFVGEGELLDNRHRYVVFPGEAE